MTSKEPAGRRQTEDRGKCSCGACGKTFRRLSGFDRHRTGPFSDRGCKGDARMVEQGWKQDTEGRWMAPEKPGGNMRVYPRRNNG